MCTSNFEVLSEAYVEKKREFDALKKELEALKNTMLGEIPADSFEEESSFLKVKFSEGRKTFDYKGLVKDLGLSEEDEEYAKYVKRSAPSWTIRLK